MKNRRKKQAKGRPETPNESVLLRRIERAVRRDESRSSGIRLEIGDDAALWKPRKGYDTILTTDWFLEGRHFWRNVHPPDAVGWKCLARAVSDVAAMGGVPRCCLVSLAIPQSCAKEWIGQYLRGLSRAARQLNCIVAGGDTTKFNAILINVSVVGEIRTGTAIKRSTARAGDRIFVSGRLGEAGLGLKALERRKAARSSDSSLLQKHFYPKPRIVLGNWLASHRLATAMMDVSDGLSSDLGRLCTASGVGARIFGEKLPVAISAFSHRFGTKERVGAALHGGDDYELLFCVRPSLASKIPRRFAGVKLTEIGEVTNRTGIRLIEPSGKAKPLIARGWDPFRK